MAEANESQWCDFWRRLGAASDPTQVWSQLRAAYTESWRQYHNLQHIGHCLSEFQPVQSLAKDALAVEAAIWFHDVIYDTRRKDNEERSADFAEGAARAAGAAQDFCERVRQLVLATKHVHQASDFDAALVTDIDLAILGQDDQRYARFERQIRDEYSWVSDSDFAVGRTAVLRGFLNRERIFTTDHFGGLYETRARKNLARAIAQLAG